MYKGSGVYMIRNESTGDMYIGSTRRVSRRLEDHRTMLRHQRSKNPKLQKNWNEYGEASFSYMLLEAVDDHDKLHEREQNYIDTLKPTLNSEPLAGTSLGYKHSEETRAKQRAIAANRPSPHTGHKHSDEAKQKMSEARAGTVRGSYNTKCECGTCKTCKSREWHKKAYQENKAEILARRMAKYYSRRST